MSIKGYENITHELRKDEVEKYLPMIVAKLSAHKGRANAITNEKIRDYVHDRCGVMLREPRVRKIVEHIRQAYIVQNLVASIKGYYIAECPGEMEEWLVTMRQRRSALDKTIAAGEKSLKQMTGAKQPNQYRNQKVNTSIIQPNIF